MREGRDLETLVAALEKATASDPSLKVRSPYFAVDRVTGASREHDVAIIITQNHHEIIIALECRDRSRNETVNEVEAFSAKCHDTRVHKGCIVSSKGFAEDALVKAQHLSIGCYTLTEAQDISWLRMTTFDTYSTQIKSNQWLLIPHQNPPEKLEKFHVEAPNGSAIAPMHFSAAIQMELKKQEESISRAVGVYHFPYRFLMEGYTLCDEVSGARYPLKHANVLAEVEVSVTQTPISKWVYRDEATGTNVIEAGIVPVSGQGVVGDLMFVSGANGITVSFRPGGQSRLS